MQLKRKASAELDVTEPLSGSAMDASSPAPNPHKAARYSAAGSLADEATQPDGGAALVARVGSGLQAHQPMPDLTVPNTGPAAADPGIGDDATQEIGSAELPPAASASASVGRSDSGAKKDEKSDAKRALSSAAAKSGVCLLSCVCVVCCK